MLDFEKEITDRYDIDLKGIVPLKDTFLINTSKGKKILKKSAISPERIFFVHGAKEHLYNKNFRTTDRFFCTKEGAPCFSINECNYTINDIVEGNECNFDNRNDIINASKLLASMHNASKGYKQPEKSMARDELGKLPGYFSKRLDEIKKLKKAAARGKSKFDYLFLKHVDYFYLLGEETIQALKESHYEELVMRAKEEGVFCHHDFTYRNIICNTGGMTLINFDFCCFELRIYDLANFLRRKMRKCNWNINEAGVIMENYNSVESLKSQEYEVLLLLLKFPQKFWRVANKYYNSRRSWSEKSYIDKLQEVLDEVEYHKHFIEKFDTLK